jgi:hypothetical protein
MVSYELPYAAGDIIKPNVFNNLKYAAVTAGWPPPVISVSLSHRISEIAAWAYSGYGGPTFRVSVITANLIPWFAVYHGFLSAKRHYNIQQWVHYTFNGGFPDCGLGCSSAIAHKWTAAAISPLTYHRNSSLIVFSIFHACCISEYNIAFKPPWKDVVHCRQAFCQAETMSSYFPNLDSSSPQQY